MTASQKTDAPVFFALVQVRFNTIEDMGEYITSLQKVMREQGFPDYFPETKYELQVKAGADAANSVRHLEHTRWVFNDIEKQSGFVLLKNQLVFQTTNYSNFGDFLEKLLKGLSVVHETVGLAYVERIGLRYLDAAIPTSDKNLEDLLHPGQLGLYKDLKGDIRHAFTETVTAIDDGTLVGRALVTKQGVVIPPDLQPLNLDILDKFKGVGEKDVAVIDIDYFKEKREKIDFAAVREKIVSLHDVVKEAFETATTETARREIWKL